MREQEGQRTRPAANVEQNPRPVQLQRLHELLSQLRGVGLGQPRSRWR